MGSSPLRRSAWRTMMKTPLFPLDAASPRCRGDRVPRKRRWRRRGLTLLLPALVLVLAAGCAATPPPPPKKAAEVVATTAVRGEVVEHQDFTGRLDGFRTVDVR